MPEPIIIQVCKNPFYGPDLLVHMCQERALPHSTSRLAVVTDLVMQEQKPGEYFGPAKPLVTLDATAAQILMDNLWDCGVRPTEGAGSAGAFAAQAAHLEDMRKLVALALKTTL
jgi:hypothetical protein